MLKEGKTARCFQMCNLNFEMHSLGIVVKQLTFLAPIVKSARVFAAGRRWIFFVRQFFCVFSFTSSSGRSPRHLHPTSAVRSTSSLFIHLLVKVLTTSSTTSIPRGVDMEFRGVTSSRHRSGVQPRIPHKACQNCRFSKWGLHDYRWNLGYCWGAMPASSNSRAVLSIPGCNCIGKPSHSSRFLNQC